MNFRLFCLRAPAYTLYQYSLEKTVLTLTGSRKRKRAQAGSFHSLMLCVLLSGWNGQQGLQQQFDILITDLLIIIIKVWKVLQLDSEENRKFQRAE